MSQNRSFDDLMAQLRLGDENAATELFNRFTGRLIGLARCLGHHDQRRGSTLGT